LFEQANITVSNILTNKAVKVIDQPDIIKVLADPVRREILRLLRHESQTQTQLARALNISKPTMKYHIRLLQQSKLVKIAFMQIESHGINQKYFEPTSSIFIEDFQKTPQNIQKYFLQLHIERLRGMLSVFQLIGTKRGDPIIISSQELKDLAYEIAQQLAKVGKKYETNQTPLNRETLLIKIYSEALNRVMTEAEWKTFFDDLRTSEKEVLETK
jgi:DNA-binding transcriptional ArsR family regulator